VICAKEPGVGASVCMKRIKQIARISFLKQQCGRVSTAAGGKVLPVVEVADGEIEFDVKAAQFQQSRVAALGFLDRLLADFSDICWGKVAGVEQVVDVR
jgi:hypothetical protein